jgi:hypothetical protein
MYSARVMLSWPLVAAFIVLTEVTTFLCVSLAALTNLVAGEDVVEYQPVVNEDD